MDEWPREECPHYEEEHDMGATIPICRKDGSVCDGCKKREFLPPQDAVLLLFLMACAGSMINPELLNDPPEPFEPKQEE